MAITVASWRTARVPGLCIMTARVPEEETTEAGADVLLQFRRQKPAALPFATSDLAFIVQIDQGMKERPLFVDIGTHRLTLLELSPQKHMMTGKKAEALLLSLASGPGELTVKPENAPGYAIPISPQDFDFAYANFAKCLADLKAT